MGYQTIEAKPVAGALGAVIQGIDLSRELDNAQASDLHQALLDHCVIFFRDQKLTPERHLALGRRFGTLNVHEFVEAMPGHPEILVVAKYEEDTKNFGGGWHSDVTYLDKPALGSILYALEVPDHGGDTMFANQYLAYEALSPGMRRMLDGLVAVHSARGVYGVDADNVYARRDGLSAMKIIRNEAAHRETEHPVVRTHPETGRKCLYVNPGFTVRFEDMTVEESRPLLDYLYQHAVRPEFTCRFRWEKGSIAFWDNRCLQHYALNDYHGQRRMMHRVTIDGDRPV
jgi:taurine dioxygenase